MKGNAQNMEYYDKAGKESKMHGFLSLPLSLLISIKANGRSNGIHAWYILK